MSIDVVRPTFPSAPQVAAIPTIGGLDTANAILDNVTDTLARPLPPMYTQGTSISEPIVKPIHQFTPQSTENQPMTNQATEIKRARQKNNFAAIGNVIGQARQAFEEKRQTLLVSDLKQVMTARQNIGNATSVLKADPNNALAKQVLEANKKQLNAILSDPKKQKQLEKALDISFTDMEKNKTPEVGAFLQAQKEVSTAGHFNYDNPQEAAVAKAAEAVNNSGASSNQAQPQPQQQAQPRSTTPYADKLLNKDLPTIETNPLYTTALAQREAAQKQLMTVVPRIIEGQAKLALQGYKDQNSASMALFKAQDQAALQAMKDTAAMDRVSAEGKNRMAVAIQQGRNQIMAAQARVAATLGVTGRKDLDAAAKKQIADKELSNLDKDIATVSQNMTRASNVLDTQGANEAATEAAQVQLKYQRENLKQLQEMRNKLLGITEPPPNDKDPAPSKDKGPGFLSRTATGVKDSLNEALVSMGLRDVPSDWPAITKQGESSNVGDISKSATAINDSDIEKAGADLSDESSEDDDYSEYLTTN